MKALHYFAYGSNMSIARLRARVPSAEKLGCYRLHGYELRFHKAGRDGSAKCDAFHTGLDEHVIHGVLFRIDPAERPALDRAEGLGHGYTDMRVRVIGTDGGLVEAFTYQALLTDAMLRPYSWYLNHVLVGARESGLPPDYIARIEAWHCLQDHDRERDARERAIHLDTHSPG
ncbi:MAG: gamma-glutamylcyclotransferase [Woeseiaceae bacterium]|jgi:gamma-glutamylcyclotransferase